MGDDYTAPVVQQKAQVQEDILKSTLCRKCARYLHKGTDFSKTILKAVQQEVRYQAPVRQEVRYQAPVYQAPVRQPTQVQWIEPPAPVQPV
jgi:hypothetical protein